MINRYLLKRPPFILQLMRFAIVGLIAASVHFCTVVLLVQCLLIAPLLANIVGFLAGFQVTYWGHHLWTFSEVAVLHRIALPKLLLVQLIAFAANELLFYIFLSLHLSYWIALLIVLTILPIFTFIVNKRWVFC